MRYFLALFLLLSPAAVRADSAHGQGDFTKHQKGSFFAVTAEKRFSIEMEIEGNELKVGANKATIVIHDTADKDVKGARITLEPWMPGMGHGVPEKPVVTEEEGFFGSRYRVDNLVVNMGGHWEILVEVEKEGVKDGAVFDFPSVGGQGKGGMKHNLASTAVSQKKIFSVTYASDPSPSPMNRIHSWKLTLRDSAGKPVTGADITVDGDMPEHGHGLPTEPEVTGEIEPGVYLLEGVKFSMPGWWVVNLHIKSGTHEDRATFNLDLK